MFGAVLPHMLKAGGGTIVNIGSVNGLSYLGHPAYSAAKAGLVNLTQAIATEYGARGIRANIICPGTVRTPTWNERARRYPQLFDRLQKWYRWGAWPSRSTSRASPPSWPRTRPPSSTARSWPPTAASRRATR